MENRKSRASVIFLSLAGTPVDGEYEPKTYRVPQFNDVDLYVFLVCLSLALRGGELVEEFLSSASKHQHKHVS